MAAYAGSSFGGSLGAIASQQIAQSYPHGIRSAARANLMNARGGAEFGAKISDYLGPPMRHGDTPGFAFNNTTTSTRPDAYVGKTLEFLVSTIDETIDMLPSFPQEILPPLYTEHINVRVVKHTFNRTLPRITAPMAPSYLMSQGRTETAASLERYSLAFHINTEFYKTEQGVAAFITNVTNLASCVLNGRQAEIFRALFSTPFHSPYAEALFNYGGQPTPVLSNIFEQDRKITDMLKRQKGMDFLHEYATDIMDKTTRPNTYLVPPQTLSLITVNDPQQTEYFNTGDRSRRNLEKGRYAADTYKGFDVYVVPTYELESQNVEENMSLRDRQFGAYNYMRDFHLGQPGYTTNRACTAIYDCERLSGGFSPIHLKDAVDHAVLFDESGNINPKLQAFLARINEGNVRAGKGNYYHPLIRRSMSGNKFEIVKQIGDMEPGYLSFSHLKDIARSCSSFREQIKKASDGFLSESIINSLSQGKSLLEQLNKPNLNDEDQVAFMVAAASQAAADNDELKVLPSNEFGGIDLPTFQNPNNGRFTIANEARRPYRFMGQILTANSKKPAEALALAIPALNLRFNYNLPKAELDQIIATVDSNNTAANVDLGNAPTVEQLRNFFKETYTAVTGANIPNEADFDQWVENNYRPSTEGFQSTLPYGFGTWAGIRTMAKKYREGNLPPFYARFEREFSVADNFEKVVNAAVQSTISVFPGNTSLDDQFCPSWQRPDARFSNSAFNASVCAYVHTLVGPYVHPVYMKLFDAGVDFNAQPNADISDQFGFRQKGRAIAILRAALYNTNLGQKFLVDENGARNLVQRYDARMGIRGSFTNDLQAAVLGTGANQLQGEQTDSITIFYNMMKYADGQGERPANLRDWSRMPISVSAGSVAYGGAMPYALGQVINAVNTRLTFDGSVFQKWVVNVSQMNNDESKAAALNTMIIKPANPMMPTIAIDEGNVAAGISIQERLTTLARVKTMANTRNLSNTPLAVDPNYARNLQYGNNNLEIKHNRFDSQNNLVERYNKIASSNMDPLDKLFASLYVLQPLNGRTIESFINNDIVLPFDIVLCRPFEQYTMGTILLLEKGDKLGHLLIGPESFYTQSSAKEDLMFFKFVTHYGTVVLGPERILPLLDVISFKYVKGQGVNFVDYRSFDPSRLNAEDVNQGDIFSFVVPFGSTGDRAADPKLNMRGHFDISGMYRKEFYESHLTEDNNVDWDDVHFSTAAYYDYVYNFSNIHTHHHYAIDQLRTNFFAGNNTMCFQETQLVPDLEGSFNRVLKTPNLTQFGETLPENAKRFRQMPLTVPLPPYTTVDENTLYRG